MQSDQITFIGMLSAYKQHTIIPGEINSLPHYHHLLIELLFHRQSEEMYLRQYTNIFHHRQRYDTNESRTPLSNALSTFLLRRRIK